MTKSTPKSTIISCVYDILGDSRISKWYNDGTIELSRPTVNVNLENIKFRSFSANIKSDIQNLTSPNINAKLCANFTWYKNQKQTVDPPSGASSDVIEGTEIPITPYVQDLRVTLYNQGGVQQYEAANGLYHNDINNDIVFTEFNVPLVTSFQDSVNDMLKYAKYNLTRLLGLYNDDQAFNKNIYDTSTFVYGDVNIKPYIPELGGAKWINSSYSFMPTVSNNNSRANGISYESGVEDPELNVGTFIYKNTSLTNPSYSINRAYSAPFCFMKSFKSLRNDSSKSFELGVLNDENMPVTSTVSKPWSTSEINRIKNPFNYYRIEFSNAKVTNTSFSLIGSVLQNKNNYSFVIYDNTRDTPYTRKEEIKDMLSFNNIYKNNQDSDYAKFTVRYINNAGRSTVASYSKLYKNNSENETMQIMIDSNYFLISVYFFTEDAMSAADPKGHIILLFSNNVNIRVLHFKGFNPTSMLVFPEVSHIVTLQLPKGKRFAFIDQIWDESNYLEYLRDLQNAAVPNAPMFILPKFDDGTNCALIFRYYDDGRFECDLIGNSTEGWNENIFYNNSTIYCIRRRDEKVLISSCGPCCALNDKVDFSLKISHNDFIMFRNYFYVNWAHKMNVEESKMFRDITTFVNDYNLQFPIVNAFGMYTYPWDSINENNYDLQLMNDSIVWLIDAKGSQVYLKDQTFENIYSFAQSALSVSFTDSEDEAKLNKYIMYPAIPTIGEPSTLSSTTYSWINDKHITSTFANPYFYANDSIYSFIDNTFKVDDDGKITFPCVPVVTKDGSSSGLLTFFVKFETSPAVFTFDPNIKQSDRFANMYNFTKQFINRTPSLYNDKYPFDDYIFYNNKILYDNLTVYLELKNRDLTLKLRCLNYPSPDNVVFYLNETSMVDFKECVIPAIMNHLTLLIIDADGEVLTPELAKNIYSNINICIDWEFMS